MDGCLKEYLVVRNQKPIQTAIDYRGKIIKQVWRAPPGVGFWNQKPESQQNPKQFLSVSLGQQSLPPTSAYLLFVPAPLLLLLWHSLHMATPASALLMWLPHMPRSDSVVPICPLEHAFKTEDDVPPRILCPTKLPIKCEERIKTLSDMQ